jgi:FixJ family two-component response regulator
LRDRGVSIPAVVITGHPNRRLRERIAAAGVPLLEKPFLGNILMDRIREALGQDLC